MVDILNVKGYDTSGVARDACGVLTARDLGAAKGPQQVQGRALVGGPGGLSPP